MSILLIFLSLALLNLPAFAQDRPIPPTRSILRSPNEHTETTSITCGNGVCETISIYLNKGEEKQVEIAGEPYNFKLLDIIKKEYPISVNGEEIKGGEKEILEKYGFKSHIVPIREEDFIFISVRETMVDDCAVPDCSFRVELDLYKKWNVIPLYFLFDDSQQKVQLQKGTCELNDFLVIYGYNPVEKDYVRLHAYGGSENNFGNSIIKFKRADGTLINTPFNSVWVHSLTECELVAEIPNVYENLLSLLGYAREEGATNIASGWNFLAGSKDMEGKSFDEIKGSCLIEKAYTFDASAQSWNTLESAPGVGTNFLFKVKDKCMFGHKIPEVPALPE